MRTAITPPDRKSTRLNSSHSQISYAVFCLKKKMERSADLRACAAAAAEADALLSFARIACECGWTRPLVDGSDVLEVEGGRHPVVERALPLSGEGPFVPNDLSLDGERRLVLLTRPNMAGNSTATPPVPLLALLAQSGRLLPAARVPP